MNSESPIHSPFEAQRDAEIISALDLEQQRRNASPSNGPIIGMAVMASIAIPLMCVAALRMRSPITGNLSGASASAPAAAAPATPQYIYWNFNYDAAKQLAITANKSMMIDFYTDWCPTCKNLDAQVYSQPAIAAEAQNIIPLKINAEQQVDLAQKYNVTKYPTIIWTDAQGNEKFRQIGGSSAYDFYQTMQQYR